MSPAEQHPAPPCRNGAPRRFLLLFLLFAASQAGLIGLALQDGRTSPLFALLYALPFALLPALSRAFPLHGARGLGLALLLGLAFRLAWLAAPPDWDIWRYIWEGVVQLAGRSPYLLPPDAPALKDLAAAHQAVWSKVFSREMTAIYPPGLELLFRLAAGISPTPGFFKSLMVLLDMGSLAALAALLTRRGIPPGRLLYWALNPLALLFIAGDGHAEPAQILPLLLGLWCMESGRARRGFLLLGLAAAMKYFAVLALPFVLRRDNLRHAWWTLVPGLLFLPFASSGARVFSTLATFSGQHFWGFAAEILWPFLGAATPAALALLLAACLAAILLAVHDALRGAALALACLVTLMPTLHPWYLAPAAVFLPLFPSRAWLWLCAAQALCLPVDWTRLGLMDWDWLWRLRWGVFLGLLAWGIWRDGRCERDHRWPRPHSLSLIIPVLNEADRMEECLRGVEEAGGASEVIVADGGSIDGTPEMAARLGALVVTAEAGRGGQIAAGARAASGDVLAVLHADCRPLPGAFTGMLDALAASPSSPGGAVTMRYARENGGFTGLRPAAIALLNNLRGLLASLCFGDQLQFARREALLEMGGFPELALMEDVELSLRLKEMGPCLFLGGGLRPLVDVSGRRWARTGFAANAGGVVLLLGRWLLERRLGLARPARQYYTLYYERKATGEAGEKSRQP